MKPRSRGKERDPRRPSKEQSNEEREEMVRAEQAQQKLEESLRKLQQRLDDPETSPVERERLGEVAEKIGKMLKESENGQSDGTVWEQMVQTDQAESLIEAIARGESLPDQQWNKLLSKLDDGLWQVRGSQPPEVYRKAIEQYQDRIRELMPARDD